MGKRVCFVIMPFSTTASHNGEHWNKHFDGFIKPLVEEIQDVEAQRSKPLRGDILRQIIADLVTSPVVVADLTDANANVYWELGVRQSFRHGTVTIAEAGTPLPFDIGAKGTLFYHPSDIVKNEDFRRRFKEAISDCLIHPDSPDSHVLESVSGRGSLFEIFHRDEAVRRLRAVLCEIDRNESLIEKLFDQVEINQRDPTKRMCKSDYFCLAAVELLLTNRYIDEEEPFFTMVQSYWNRHRAMNEHLLVWVSASDMTEKWFLSMKPLITADATALRLRVESAMLNLSKRV